MLQMAAKRGARCYLAVAGGIDTPVYLGSRSTFPGGKLGGVQVSQARWLCAVHSIQSVQVPCMVFGCRMVVYDEALQLGLPLPWESNF